MAAVRRLISPSDWVSRQVDTLKSVGEKNYRQGIANPKKDPIEAGIAAEGKFANAMREAIDTKRRASGLGKTNMAEWAGYAENIGAGKLVEGVTKRQAKVTKFVAAWQPTLSSHVSNMDALPVETASDRNAKVIANLEGLRALKGKA